jgi:Tfp pilus assembly protein PilP
MKKRLVILAVILCAGCGEMTPQQRQVWGEAFQNMSQMQHEQNMAQWRYSQPQIIQPNNSTYWQEANARRQMYERK